MTKLLADGARDVLALSFAFVSFSSSFALVDVIVVP